MIDKNGRPAPRLPRMALPAPIEAGLPAPGQDERWAYRRAAVDRILEAVVAMIMQTATPASQP